MLTRPDNAMSPPGGGLAATRPASAGAASPGARAPGDEAAATGAASARSETLTVFFAGRAVSARAGDSVAAALLAAGITVTRSTPVTGAARGPYCMMGACFDCLAVVDGRASVQTCMTPARDGMRIERQDGARGLAIEAAVQDDAAPAPDASHPPPAQPSSAVRPKPATGGAE